MSTQVRVSKQRVEEGPVSSTRTTTYETRTSYESDVPTTYRTNIAPRTTVIQRSSYGGPGLQSQYSRQSYSGSMAGAGISAGAFATVAKTGMSDVVDTRHKEKKDMQDLNERFASYIEKVRFLEAQNRKLADELEKLKAKWGKETTAIKAMYQAELDEARRLLDEAEKEKAKFQIRADSLEEQLIELREQLERTKAESEQHRLSFEGQIRTISDMEAEINLLRQRIASLEADRDKDRKEIQRLTDALNRARIDLDQETLAHIDAENRRQTLEEELEFLKQVHEQEMKELAALAYRDTTKENREFWKNEMGNALREIQETYDQKCAAMRGELETFYNLKIQEFRTGATRQGMETNHAKEESKRMRTMLTDLRAKLADLEARNAALERELDSLRKEYSDKEHEWESENTELKNEVAKLRAEMEAILKELQEMMDTKLGLELEIAAYRKLLEGEENRINLRGMVTTMMTESSSESHSMSYGGDDSSLKVSQVVKGEMSAKTTYQRSAKGPVSISECAGDGKSIVLENTGRKEEDLSGWQIVRTVDGSKRDPINLQSISIKPGGKVRLCAQGKVPAGERNAKELSVLSFGIGANVTTSLQAPNGEDRATHVQKTIYTS